MQTTDKKYSTYFFNDDFEQTHESYIASLKDTLLVIKNKVENEGLNHKIFEDLLFEKENGLRAILVLTAF